MNWYRITLQFHPSQAVKSRHLTIPQVFELMNLTEDFIKENIDGQFVQGSIDNQDFEFWLLIDLDMKTSPSNAGHKIKKYLAGYIQQTYFNGSKLPIWKHEISISNPAVKVQ